MSPGVWQGRYNVDETREPNAKVFGPSSYAVTKRAAEHFFSYRYATAKAYMRVCSQVRLCLVARLAVRTMPLRKMEPSTIALKGIRPFASPQTQPLGERKPKHLSTLQCLGPLLSAERLTRCRNNFSFAAQRGALWRKVVCTGRQPGRHHRAGAVSTPGKGDVAGQDRHGSRRRACPAGADRAPLVRARVSRVCLHPIHIHTHAL